jgi:hypothetical protein
MFACATAQANIFIINTDIYFIKIFQNYRLIKTIHNNNIKNIDK